MEPIKPSNNNLVVISIVLIALFVYICISVDNDNKQKYSVESIESVQVSTPIKKVEEKIISENEQIVKQDEVIQKTIPKEDVVTKESNNDDAHEKVYVIANWEKEPIKLNRDSINLLNYCRYYDAYKTGEVLDGIYGGADIIVFQCTGDFPITTMRAIKNKDECVIINDNNVSVHKSNIFISNLYPFNEIKLNLNVSLVRGHDFENQSNIFFKDLEFSNDDLILKDYMIYKKEGKFFGMNNDGSTQKYYFKPSFTSCVGGYEIERCLVSLNFINNIVINGTYTMAPIYKGCLHHKEPGYNYNENIIIDNLRQIGVAEDGTVLYEPKDVQKYLLDNYKIDSHEGYDYPIVFWKDPFGDFIEMINMDFYNSKYSHC